MNGAVANSHAFWFWLWIVKVYLGDSFWLGALAGAVSAYGAFSSFLLIAKELSFARRTPHSRSRCLRPSFRQRPWWPLWMTYLPLQPSLVDWLWAWTTTAGHWTNLQAALMCWPIRSFPGAHCWERRGLLRVNSWASRRSTMIKATVSYSSSGCVCYLQLSCKISRCLDRGSLASGFRCFRSDLLLAEHC